MCRIESFLNDNFQAKQTRNMYRCILKKYFEIVGSDPETYFQEGRDYKADVKKYKNEFLNDRPPKTYNSYMSAINSFLMENDVELGAQFWRTLRGRKKGANSNRAVTKDRVPTLDELRKILSHGGAKESAFFIILASSGMRIGELCNLNRRDVYLDENPVRIDIPAEITKTGERRTTYMSREAANFLREWYKVREAYIEKAIIKNNLPGVHKTINDDRIFPFNKITGWRSWEVMAGKAELDEKDTKTNRAVLHPHALRKFFRTKMGKAIGVDMTEALMGHSGYMTEYRKYSDKELAEAYQAGEGAVLVFEREIAQDLTAVNEQLKDKDLEIQTLREENQAVKADLLEMRLTLLELKDKINGKKLTK